MPWSVAAAVGGAVVGNMLSSGDRKAANRAAQSSSDAAWFQAEQAAREQDRADEMWARYKEQYYPLEEKVVAEAQEGIKPDYEGVATEARRSAADTSDQFVAQSKRAMNRYNVKPYAALDRTSAMSRAAMMDDAANTARTQERYRVEDVNWNRRMQALSLGRGLPAQVSAANSNAAAASGRSAGIYNQLAQLMASDAREAASAGTALTRQIFDAVGKGMTPTPDTRASFLDRAGPTFSDTFTNMENPAYG